MQAINFHKCEFSISAQTLAQCPADQGAEIAFAGRSNAGKSSALNKLTNNRKLARTSKTPGRTQLINYFTFGEDNLRLVDLPGYGYAKVSKDTKMDWDRHLAEYLEKRQSLIGLVMLMDIRHPMKDSDIRMLKWAVSAELPVHVLLTKADKLKSGAAKAQLFKALAQSKKMHGVTMQLFSSQDGTGLDDLNGLLNRWFEPPGA